MKELEKTYLAKFLPSNLKSCKSKEIIDMYIPKSSDHPIIRIRKNGDAYEITKKYPVEDDPSHQHEHTIPLTKQEFDELSKLDAKKVHKIRYLYDHGRMFEFDIFQDPLKGLILIDAEFSTIQEKDAFEMPDFCLAEVTPELFIAGGMLCGKSYEDIEEDLARYNYKKLFLE